MTFTEKNIAHYDNFNILKLHVSLFLLNTHTHTHTHTQLL